jgi:probable rRNA maturation factor
MITTAIDNRSEQELPLQRAGALASFVLEREFAGRRVMSGDLELSLSFVGRDEIRQLNAAYRGKDEATDVLSFQLDDPWANADSDEMDCLLLGDIVIQPDIARERSVKEEVDFETELWILIIHGILHLIGYDHMTPDDAAKMEAREDEHLFQWERKLEAQ